jgi:hypothetical protein
MMHCGCMMHGGMAAWWHGGWLSVHQIRYSSAKNYDINIQHRSKTLRNSSKKTKISSLINFWHVQQSRKFGATLSIDKAIKVHDSEAAQ